MAQWFESIERFTVSSEELVATRKKKKKKKNKQILGKVIWFNVYPTHQTQHGSEWLEQMNLGQDTLQGGVFWVWFWGKKFSRLSWKQRLRWWLPTENTKRKGFDLVSLGCGSSASYDLGKANSSYHVEMFQERQMSRKEAQTPTQTLESGNLEVKLGNVHNVPSRWLLLTIFENQWTTASRVCKPNARITKEYPLLIPVTVRLRL